MTSDLQVTLCLSWGGGIGGGFSVSTVCCPFLSSDDDHRLVFNEKWRRSPRLGLSRRRLAGRCTGEGRRYLVVGQLQRGHGLHVQKEVRRGLRSLTSLLVLGIQVLTVDDQEPEEIQVELQEGWPRASAQL